MTRLVSRNQLWTLFLRLVIFAAARGEKLTGDKPGMQERHFCVGVNSIALHRLREGCLQRSNGINNHKEVILASEAENFSVTAYTGRGFTVDKGHATASGCSESLFELFLINRRTKIIRNQTAVPPQRSTFSYGRRRLRSDKQSAFRLAQQDWQTRIPCQQSPVRIPESSTGLSCGKQTAAEFELIHQLMKAGSR